jgi:putative mRNA 3-end processing factor
VSVKAEVKRFDFSGHSGRTELFEMLSALKGKPKVYTTHGDGNTCEVFASQITEKYGFESRAPDVGDKIVV